jgi:hypothetical protein
VIHAGLGKNRDPVSNITRAKNATDVTQAVKQPKEKRKKKKKSHLFLSQENCLSPGV